MRSLAVGLTGPPWDPTAGVTSATTAVFSGWSAMVVCFQETIIRAIGFHVRPMIGAEENTICIVQEKPPGAIRLSPQFADARADVDIEIRAFVE